MPEDLRDRMVSVYNGSGDAQQGAQSMVIDVCGKDVNEKLMPQYIANLSKYLDRVREIHWHTDVDKIHNLSNELIWRLQDTMDSLSEEYMGACGCKFEIGFLSLGCECDVTELKALLECLKADTQCMADALRTKKQFESCYYRLMMFLSTINELCYKETQK